MSDDAAAGGGFTLTGPMSASADMLPVFSDRAAVQRMLDFEAALARAEAAHGVIPAEAVAPIAACCQASRLDLPALAQAAAAAGNLHVPRWLGARNRLRARGRVATIRSQGARGRGKATSAWAAPRARAPREKKHTINHLLHECN